MLKLRMEALIREEERVMNHLKPYAEMYISRFRINMASEKIKIAKDVLNSLEGLE